MPPELKEEVLKKAAGASLAKIGRDLFAAWANRGKAAAAARAATATPAEPTPAAPEATPVAAPAPAVTPDTVPSPAA
jgi:hypothetical protein